MKKLKTAALILSMGSLSGCNIVQQMAYVGEVPEKSQIQDPTLVEDYHPVSMPMPTPEPQSQSVNSLWQTGSRAFFKDQRASRVGDIITIDVDMKEETVKTDSTTTFDRGATNRSSMPNLLGYESKLKYIFPKAAVDPNNLINTNSATHQNGTGKLERKDTLKIKIAATIVQILPNGNLVIQGRQEVLFSRDLRIVEIKGIVRREDIASDNSIPYSKISEARISHTSKGDVSDMSTIPWGQQALTRIWPW